MVETTKDYPGIGLLTSTNRDTWATNYTTLASNPHNAAILEDIQSAAFVLCLDTEQPKDIIQHSRFLWHGSSPASDPNYGGRLGLHNRWVDKPVQIIVFDNAEAGIMGEHSVMDGTPTVTLCDTVLNMLADPAFDHSSPTPSGTPASQTKGPEPLDFEVDQTIETALKSAEQESLELVDSQTLNMLKTGYGKRAIKSFGVSPDSYAQMIVQLAYARLIGGSKNRQGGTYEAATTRRFLKGRTEAIRVVSSESDRWVKSMDNPACSEAEKKSLFELACKKHVELAKEAGKAEGVDRHILG